MVNTKVFSKNSDIPRFTNLGFKKIKIPDPIWKAILEMYQDIKFITTYFPHFLRL